MRWLAVVLHGTNISATCALDIMVMLMTDAPTLPSPRDLLLFHTLPVRGVMKGVKGRGFLVLSH